MKILARKLNTAMDWFNDLHAMAKVAILIGLFFAIGIPAMALEKDTPSPVPSASEVLAQQRAEIDSELFMCVLGDDAPGLGDSLLLLALKNSEDEDGKEAYDAVASGYLARFREYSRDPVLYENCVHDVARYDPEYRDSLMEKYNEGRTAR